MIIKNLTKQKIYLLLFIMLTFFTSFLYNHVIIDYSEFSNIKIGIIDDALSAESKCIIEKNNTQLSKNTSHGDALLDFIEDSSNIQVYYYDASNENGIIDSEGILDGLEWLKSKNVTFINISLSSKKLSRKLENWLKNNPEIKVFSSYNNNIQSADYPSMYNTVTGSGVNGIVMDDAKDKIYRTNRIFLPKELTVYHGNSYLSILTMLEYIKEYEAINF